MKRRWSFSWKKIALCTAGAFLAARFFVEYFWIAVVFLAAFVLSLALLGASVRRERRERERAKEGQEAAAWQREEARREACREARYHREEQERIEAHIQRALGPIAEWDLERGAELLCLDAALVPPTEALPFWKAATMGAGAYTAEGEDPGPVRAELVMALPPDWDPSLRWPVRILRGAARRLLIVDGRIGRGSLYRGSSAVSAGFAGAVVTDCFPGLPDLGAAAMPDGLPVRFFWLAPLLKPELDYCLKLGVSALARRFRAESPWADPGREPLVEALTWFQEEIAPFAWSEDDGLYCLGLEIGEWHRELFWQAGCLDLAQGWEKLAREYLRLYQPEDLPFVEFACGEGTFFAASHDEEIMRELALGLSSLLRDRPAEARRLLY